ncbi:bifunctional protein FolD [Siccirubricoccus deserti]|uniref:Bifunctional protein FolD n=1 Tax=Siccirubricoccus deserti TaxID=2013562 RepID=A0A9X0R037_9PROT|nr:bifunctional methylenetetrahydrofolate dehydrogenase/methenyltetrahydrofolate cyclohydrolase FolD [Siccirubricoccus deserti]MBC4017075.1 bifunctional methylenetetrahydrofolate dehydrogenase/methenyltetrahydrofolate cyclohydrolase FolD [Siccirubricoccus deserti]GGC56336.1 bifunctional protein FolD [Siccirubricoccus deserti]
MTARIIDGKAVAERLRAGLATRIAGLHFRPGLRVVRVGEDPASGVYVRNKDRAALAAGFDSSTIHLPAEARESDLLMLVENLNIDPAVDGILVQLPLPPQIRPEMVIAAIDPAKDVDGFHTVNAGKLVTRQHGLVPCTPKGVMHLLREAGATLRGARAVVLGRSQIVGRPMAQLLLDADCTVTMVHSNTRDLAAECRRAEILVAAVGKPELVRGDWVGEGAIVIDVGINRNAAGKLVGDVAFAEALPRAAAITPVPGGVGPMTIACLLENTLEAALARRGHT